MGYWPASSSSPARFLSAGSCRETSAAKIRAVDQVMTARPAMPAGDAGGGDGGGGDGGGGNGGGVVAIEARQLGPVD
jgi:hypothetical protein